MFEPPPEHRPEPRSISRRCRSARAATDTRGGPSSIPAQATGSSIHAATTVTTPGATSTCTKRPARRSSRTAAGRAARAADASGSERQPPARHGQNDPVMLGGRHGLLEVLKAELQLVGVEPLRAPAEPATLQLPDQQPQLLDLGSRRIVLGAKGVPLGQSSI